MAFPSLIPSLAQFPQLLAGSILALEPVEGANSRVECVLAPGELVGGLPHSALDRGASLDTGEQFLHRVDDSALGDRCADRHPLRAVANRRATIDRIGAVVRAADDHPSAAGAAAEHPQTREQ